MIDTLIMTAKMELREVAKPADGQTFIDTPNWELYEQTIRIHAGKMAGKLVTVVCDLKDDCGEYELCNPRIKYMFKTLGGK